ncbi:MAG: radical SAM protein [Candidatus Hydrothermarchaeales archaeon]
MKCGFETGNVRCRPATCPACSAPKTDFAKKE